MSYFFEANVKAIADKRKLTDSERLAVAACMEVTLYTIGVTRNIRIICAAVDTMSAASAVSMRTKNPEALLKNRVELDAIQDGIASTLKEKYGTEVTRGSWIYLSKIANTVFNNAVSETILDLLCLIIEDYKRGGLSGTQECGEPLFDKDLPTRLLTMEFAS